MRRRVVIVMAGLTLLTAGCGKPDPEPAGGARPAVTSSSTPPTTAGTSSSTPPTAATPGTSEPSVNHAAPTVEVSLAAAAGEIPPGRVSPVASPAWRATGSGWEPGDVDLFVRSAGGEGVVLDVGARADSSGSWEQTFVLSGVPAGPYLAVASQGSLYAEGPFVVAP